MGDFTIQISSNLVNRLVDDVETSKKKTKRTKPKVPKEPQQPQSNVSQKQIFDDSGMPKSAAVPGWSMQPPSYLPAIPPPQSANSEVESVRSVLHESEEVVERLQKQEENMLREVTQKAKDLRDNEYKLPAPKPMPCVAELDSSLACFKEHTKDPLECASLVSSLGDCMRRFRHQVSV
ncbi:hypothetical protein L6164_028122 [Bauhinia variegata]|uniref:Uncharacterized protein n=1 Tax=Bauhinia variegata TaxID=167791 RepID=A0ACB9LW76_BAUVA|nr:hypothetical protein L6164_028122 [Bauhinia variegata]